MCGINGLVMLNGFDRSDVMLAQIKFLFSELLVETQERGEHATGLVHFKRNGEYLFHKKDTNADVMTTTDVEYRKIVDAINDQTSAIVSHTRYYTKGKPTNNNNNHPFDIGSVVGVHNGSLSNDDELFKQYGFNRIGEVDSEIIYQLINHYNQDGVTLDGIKKALVESKIRGLMALAWVHKNQPNLVHLVKQDRPMELAYWKEAGVVIFNSQKEFIEKAFRKLRRVSQAWAIGNTDLTVEYKSVWADRYLNIDANEKTFEDALSEQVFINIASTKTTTSYWGKTGTTTTTTTSTTSSTSTTISAKDSAGRVIEGELDEATGEIIIYTSATIAGLNEDDGSGLYDENDDDELYCSECANVMDEAELLAHFNEGASKHTLCCVTCYHSTIADYMNRQEEEEENQRLRA